MIAATMAAKAKRKVGRPKSARTPDPSAKRKLRRLTCYVWACKCQRCHAEFEHVGPKPPDACPKCKRRNWQYPPLPYSRRK